MRTFTSEDGKSWIARIHDGQEDAGGQERVGWEVIQFDTEPPGTIQRISYRPSGWLNHASIQELIAALLEGEIGRAHV